jgi:hypothetical protein
MNSSECGRKVMLGSEMLTASAVETMNKYSVFQKE